MVALRCPCEKKHHMWGELWWAGGQYQWVFFDEHKTSVRYGKQVTYCPECGGQVERKNLTMINGSLGSEG
jgi:hypothetical protein